MKTNPVNDLTSLPIMEDQKKGKVETVSDYTTFLKMLTTQMQNQDPLNPTDATDYAQQLATFSQVEQNVKTNTLLKSVLEKFDDLSTTQMAEWVGKEVRSTADVYFEGMPVALSPKPAEGADKVSLIVRDKSGSIITTEALNLSSEKHIWLGTNDENQILPSGMYRLVLDSYKGDELIASEPVEHYAVVSEIQSGDNNPALILRGGARISTEDVTGLRNKI